MTLLNMMLQATTNLGIQINGNLAGQQVVDTEIAMVCVSADNRVTVEGQIDDDRGQDAGAFFVRLV